MKITAIKKQTKSPNRVSIFVDGKYSFSLSLDELLAEKLKSNLELNGADVRRLKKLSTDGKLRMRAMEWLINRPHSERELHDYLYRKKLSPEQIENFVNEFSEKGYLDNAKFSQWFIELNKRRGKSNRAIRSALFQKGVKRELIDDLMSKEEGDEPQRLREVIKKKSELSRYRDDPLKLAKYLTSQGFSYSQVKKILKLNT